VRATEPPAGGRLVLVEDGHDLLLRELLLREAEHSLGEDDMLMVDLDEGQTVILRRHLRPLSRDAPYKCVIENGVRGMTARPTARSTVCAASRGRSTASDMDAAVSACMNSDSEINRSVRCGCDPLAGRSTPPSSSIPSSDAMWLRPSAAAVAPFARLSFKSMATTCELLCVAILLSRPCLSHFCSFRVSLNLNPQLPSSARRSLSWSCRRTYSVHFSVSSSVGLRDHFSCDPPRRG
jgi:hypothetical protein